MFFCGGFDGIFNGIECEYIELNLMGCNRIYWDIEWGGNFEDSGV